MKRILSVLLCLLMISAPLTLACAFDQGDMIEWKLDKGSKTVICYYNGSIGSSSDVFEVDVDKGLYAYSFTADSAGFYSFAIVNGKIEVSDKYDGETVEDYKHGFTVKAPTADLTKKLYYFDAGEEQLVKIESKTDYKYDDIKIEYLGKVSSAKCGSQYFSKDIKFDVKNDAETGKPMEVSVNLKNVTLTINGTDYLIKDFKSEINVDEYEKFDKSNSNTFTLKDADDVTIEVGSKSLIDMIIDTVKDFFGDLPTYIKDGVLAIVDFVMTVVKSLF